MALKTPSITPSSSIAQPNPLRTPRKLAPASLCIHYTYEQDNTSGNGCCTSTNGANTAFKGILNMHRTTFVGYWAMFIIGTFPEKTDEELVMFTMRVVTE